MKKTTKILAAFIACFAFFALSARSHPPEKVRGVYDAESGLLRVEVIHPTQQPETHYVEWITVSVPGMSRAMQEFSRQENEEYVRAYFYFPGLSTAAAVGIKAGCSVEGITEEKITVKRREIKSKYKIDFESVRKGTYGSMAEEKKLIVRGEEEWSNLWKEIYRRREPVPDIPQIDFAEKSVAAVFMGQRPTGGYSVNIERVYFKEGRLDVIYSYTEPEPGSIVTQALTQPFHLIVFDAAGEIEEISFDKTRQQE